VNLAQRFERRLETMVGSAFARVFKGQVEPVEIGAALQREASDQRAVMGAGQVLVPNRYRVTLSPADFERLVPWEVQLCNAFAELVQEHLDENAWNTLGDVEVYLAQDEALHTGVFGVASRMESDVPPRQRPYDSLSLPVVAPAPGYGDPGYGYQEADPYAQEQYGYQEPTAYDPYAAPAPAYDPYAAAPQPGYTGYDPYAAQQPAYDQNYNQPPAPAPYTSRWYNVLLVDGSDHRHVLQDGLTLIGRGQEAQFRLADQGVSRRHLEIHTDGNGAVAHDLGSTNGTTINGHPITSHRLQHGDVIRIGHTRLVFQQESG
jgi:hypothetical protein